MVFCEIHLPNVAGIALFPINAVLCRHNLTPFSLLFSIVMNIVCLHIITRKTINTLWNNENIFSKKNIHLCIYTIISKVLKRQSVSMSCFSWKIQKIQQNFGHWPKFCRTNTKRASIAWNYLMCTLCTRYMCIRHDATARMAKEKKND